MCLHELWPTSVSHPFSSLNSSLGFAGGKLLSLSLYLFFKILLFQVAFLIFFSVVILSSCWFVIAVCGSIQSWNYLILRIIVNWRRVNLMGALTFLWFFFNCLFHKGNYGLQIVLSVWGKIMIPMYRLYLRGLYGLYGPWCPMVPKRPLNLITHSLTSPSQLYHDLNPLHLHWSRQPKVFQCLTLLLFALVS